MREKDVKRRLCKAVRDFGGLAMKLNSPGSGIYGILNEKHSG